MATDTQAWNNSWFDTPYYHILYKDRDYKEAAGFIDTITQYLNLPEKSKILDLACGRGRHSKYLNALGYEVTGIDLSENSIAYAKQYENETLHFQVHDLCVPLGKQFDAVFNLFTSFGFFSEEREHLIALQAIKENLNEYGFAVIDFMNAERVISNLVAEETKEVDGIVFHIKRWFNEGFIYKNIKFNDQAQDFDFTERVKAFRLEDFEDLMEKAGIYLLEVFGDYKLSKFDREASDRLIMIFK